MAKVQKAQQNIAQISFFDSHIHKYIYIILKSETRAITGVMTTPLTQDVEIIFKGTCKLNYKKKQPYVKDKLFLFKVEP